MDNRRIHHNQVLLSETPIPLWRHSLIILAGPSGSGKSTFAQRHFLPTMHVSTDQCRAMICDSPLNQAVSDDAFEIFYQIVEKRLQHGYATVADSTALRIKYRKKLCDIAARYHFSTVLVVFALPREICIERDQRRRFRVGAEVIERQFHSMARMPEEVPDENYRQVIVFHTPRELDNFSMRWTSPLVERADLKAVDMIGDVHGCYGRLTDLLNRLGYRGMEDCLRHPQGRTAVFLGDIMDRGTDNIEVFELVYRMWRWRAACYLPGNHCNKLFRYLTGRDVQVREGLETTVKQLESLDPGARAQFVARFCQMYAQSPPYLLLDDGRLLATHAGILQRLIGRVDARTVSCCLHGPSKFEDEDPFTWTDGHSGTPLIVYGHIPVPEPRWHNNTVDIDLGAGSGGSLAAFRYPEKEIVIV